MSIKQWKDMTANEKADSLKDQLEHFINHYNGAIARTVERVRILEESVEVLTKDKIPA